VPLEIFPPAREAANDVLPGDVVTPLFDPSGNSPESERRRRNSQKGHRAFKPFKTFKRFPRYTASEGRYSGWPAVLSRRQNRSIEGRSVQAVYEQAKATRVSLVQEFKDGETSGDASTFREFSKRR
jgi:hypothetical protein